MLTAPRCGACRYILDRQDAVPGIRKPEEYEPLSDHSGSCGRHVLGQGTD